MRLIRGKIQGIQAEGDRGFRIQIRDPANPNVLVDALLPEVPEGLELASLKSTFVVELVEEPAPGS